MTTSETSRPAQPWLADVEIDSELAARAIARQFAELVPVQARPLGVGWDNAAYLVNGTWVFRFPRRRPAAEWIRNEARVLPHLAPALPVAIPVPAFLGEPDRAYPYPFVGYRMLAGTTACAAALHARDRLANAARLGELLACLHSPALAAEVAADAPGDDIGRADLQRRTSLLLQRLEHLERGPGMDGARVRAAAQALVHTPAWSGAPRWVHGDLYARHLLVDQHGTLCGVIDWGDVHRGDPALDLSIAFSFLPARARSRFVAAYGAVDEHTWARARLHALHYGVALTYYGLDVGDEALVSTGRLAIEHALPAD